VLPQRVYLDRVDVLLGDKGVYRYNDHKKGGRIDIKYRLDRNKNGIVDRLEKIVDKELKKDAYYSLIVFPRKKKLNKFMEILCGTRSIAVYKKLDIIGAFFIKIRGNKVFEFLRKIRGLFDWIEDDQKVYLQSTGYISPQNIWSEWSIDYNGSKYITVAVVDSGVDVSHPDLQGKIIYYEDLTGESTQDNPIDNIGHGTMIASIIAGEGNSHGDNIISLTHFGRLSPESSVAIAYKVMKDQISNITIAWASPIARSISVWIEYENNIVEGIVNTSEKIYTCTIQSRKGTNKIRIIPNAGTISYVIRVSLISDSEKQIYRGIAPRVKLAVWKIFSGLNASTSVSLIIQALDRISQMYRELNITVVNLSMSASDISYALDEAVNNLAARGIFVVTPAGNSYIDKYKENMLENQITSPGTAMYAITVAALNEYLGVSLYSSIGGTYVQESTEYCKPDIAMFGGGMLYGAWPIGADSDVRDYIFGDLEPNDLATNFGSSFAVAYVSGYLAILTSLAYEKGMWEWSLDNLLRMKSFLLASTFETAAIGTHEVYFWSEDKKIRTPPELSNGAKDFDEGFGMIYFPSTISLLEAYNFNSSVTKSIALSINTPVWGVRIHTRDLLRVTIRMNTTNASTVCIYKVFGDDGSPQLYWSTWRNGSTTFLGWGDVLIIGKILLNTSTLITINVERLASRGAVMVIIIVLGITVSIIVIYIITKFAKKMAKKLKH